MKKRAKEIWPGELVARVSVIVEQACSGVWICPWEKHMQLGKAYATRKTIISVYTINGL